MRRVLALCYAEFPQFEIRYKDESKLMKFLNFFVRIFNPGFMTNYITTFGTTVYFPSRKYLLEGQGHLTEVLAHELVHMWDRKSQGAFAYTFKYGSPQWFALLSLLALGAIWALPMLVFLLFLLCALPLPSVGRRNIELDGYTMSMAYHYWTAGQVDPAYITFYADQFVKSGYYFMWPFRKQVEGMLRARLSWVTSGKALKDPNFGKMYMAIKG
jgi:hypothetical protein